MGKRKQISSALEVDVVDKKKAKRAESISKTDVEDVLDIKALKRKLAKKAGIPLRCIKKNEHATPGAAMRLKFLKEAKKLQETHMVDVLLHGSPEGNVDSILRTSLSERYSRHGSAFWLTDSIHRAKGYMFGGKRLVAFGVLRPKTHETAMWGITQDDVFVCANASHLLPLFIVRPSDSLLIN